MCAFANAQSTSRRNTISLNGNWQIAEGTKDVIPNEFNHTVQVPGLVSLATPSFKESDPSTEVFWYRRTFTIEGIIPVVAMLKIAKAMFGTKVWCLALRAQSHRTRQPLIELF